MGRISVLPLSGWTDFFTYVVRTCGTKATARTAFARCAVGSHSAVTACVAGVAKNTHSTSSASAACVAGIAGIAGRASRTSSTGRTLITRTPGIAGDARGSGCASSAKGA